MLAAVLLTGAGQAAAEPPGAGIAHSVGAFGPLTDLAIDRLLVGDQVAAAKFGTGKPIDDPVREQQLLSQVRQAAGRLGIDPDVAVRFFQDQITASKVVQRGLFDRWTTHPGEVPTTHQDLAAIRAHLDQLTTAILSKLPTEQPTGAACRVQLTVASISGAALRRLDALHRHALGVAVASVCG